MLIRGLFAPQAQTVSSLRPLDHALLRGQESSSSYSHVQNLRPLDYALARFGFLPDPSHDLRPANRFKESMSDMVFKEVAGFRATERVDLAVEPPKQRTDLAERNISKRDLSGQDLSGRDFSGKILRFVKFSGANLRRANFKGADFYHVSFKGADLCGTDLSETDINRVDFDGAKYDASTKGIDSAFAKLKGMVFVEGS